MEKWIEHLKDIENPQTEKSLHSEGRFLKIDIDNDWLRIEYNREGISPQEKRIIEEEIYNALKPHWDIEKIKIMTVSKGSKDVTGSEKVSCQSKNPAPKANLKVGHGEVGSPRSIPSIKHIIAVGSGKGGVGKSTFSVNLACSLSKTGKKVGLIDADIYGPSIPILMGVRGQKPLAGDNKKINPIEKHGIKMMSFGFFIDEKDPVIWRGPMLGGVLNQFLFDVNWGNLDYLIIDLPPGTGDIQLSMVQNLKLDGAIVISTPQDVALLDAVKAFEMFKKLKQPILGMVENMSYFICDSCDKKHYLFGSGGLKQGAQEMKQTFLGSVPLEISLREASDKGTPYMSLPQYENREVWRAYMGIADKVNKKYNEKSKNFLEKLFSK